MNFSYRLTHFTEASSPSLLLSVEESLNYKWKTKIHKMKKAKMFTARTQPNTSTSKAHSVSLKICCVSFFKVSVLLFYFHHHHHSLFSALGNNEKKKQSGFIYYCTARRNKRVHIDLDAPDKQPHFSIVVRSRQFGFDSLSFVHPKLHQ